MGLRRGFNTGTTAGGFAADRGPRIFFMLPGTETQVVLLDDNPVCVVRHRMFIRGDRKALSKRMTCWGMDPEEHPRPCPRECVVCNAMLRSDNIGRNDFRYLSIIDTRAYTSKGKEYADTRCLLELDRAEAEIFEKKKKANGGSLVGTVFNVYRSNKTSSSRIGDSWDIAGTVDPVRHFWGSVAAPRILEGLRRMNGGAQHEDAVRKLVSPFDYEAIMGKYDPAEAEAFAAYACGGDVPTKQDFQSAPSRTATYEPPAYGEQPPRIQPQHQTQAPPPPPPVGSVFAQPSTQTQSPPPPPPMPTTPTSQTARPSYTPPPPPPPLGAAANF